MFEIKNIIQRLIKKKLSISVAESCTGGMLSSSITSISGASKIFNIGLVTYSNLAKIKLLKVSSSNIKRYGAVSEKCCLKMVEGLSKLSKSKINISITGIAGPKGGSKNKPVGLVYIGIKKGKKISINKYLFKNKNRENIRKNSVKEALKLIEKFI
ncbi:MAG: CinA family protein [Pelagibacteraceae bacterium]|jgi:nicotinamide-nucleotide amidase